MWAGHREQDEQAIRAGPGGRGVGAKALGRRGETMCRQGEKRAQRPPLRHPFGPRAFGGRRTDPAPSTSNAGRPVPDLQSARTKPKSSQELRMRGSFSLPATALLLNLFRVRALLSKDVTSQRLAKLSEVFKSNRPADAHAQSLSTCRLRPSDFRTTPLLNPFN